jgi:pilus assembly protein FimV
MLVALFRGNKGAFIRDNMNRMRAGVILDVPAADTVTSVDPKEARRVVVAQAADYNAYRSKLAASAAAAPAGEEAAPKQAVAGKIEPRVEEKTPAAAEGRDQLRISKSEAPAKEAGKAEKSAQTRIATLEEDLLAKDKALKEANSRLADLEKNVGELQQLLEAKNKNLAELQKQASAKPPAAPEPAVPAKPAVAVMESTGSPPSQAKPEVAIEPKPVAAEAPKAVEPPKPPELAQAPAAQPPAVAPVEPPAAKKAEAEKPAMPEKASEPPKEEPGILASLLANPAALYGGGGAVVALLGLLGYRMSQRRKAEAMPMPTTTAGKSAPPSVFGSTGGQSVDTSGSSIQTDFSHSGMAAIDADEGVDPVAEADVYMAYGRDAQAEEILLDALKNEPTRKAIHVKLLEIYAQRKNLKQFETLATELYAQTGGVGAEWEKAAAMGRKLDPANPLYGAKAGSAQAASAAATGPSAVPAAAVAAAVGSMAALSAQEAGSPVTAEVAEPQEKYRDTWAMPGELGRIEEPAGGFAPDSTMPLPPAAHPEPAESIPAALDFDLALPGEQVAAAAIAEAPAQEQPASLDFDLGVDLTSTSVGGVTAPTAEQAGGVASIDVSAAPEQTGAADAGIKPDVRTGAAEDAFAGTDSIIDRSVIEFDLGQAKEEEPAPKPQQAPPDVRVMDLERTDVAGTLIDFNLEEMTKSRPSADVAVMDLERTDVGANLLDFNFELEGARTQAPKETAPSVDLSSINLDLPEPAKLEEDVTGAMVTAGPAGDTAENPEVATKIELAKAYEEMGDRDGARELLQEVLGEGTAAQQVKARDMLARLA